MRREFTLALLALSLFSIPVLPQEPATTGSIEGAVVSADTGQPIANAKVTLTPIAELSTGAALAVNGDAGAIAPVTTGVDGKFAFKDLKPATYRVAATANGLVRQEYGQRALNGSGRLLFVVAGQSINDAVIGITLAGTISGRILDENGQPATGAPVQLLREFYNQQGKAYLSGGTASVDDRGIYRIFGVTPGRYYLMAGTQPVVTNYMGPRGGSAGSSRYSVLYYPDAASVDQATIIEVKPGSESSLDMRLNRETQTFHVRGRIINSTGAPLPQDMTVMLGYRGPSDSGSMIIPKSFDPATSTFDVPNVPPGEFTIDFAQATQPAARGGPSILEQRAIGFAASVPVHMNSADIDGLVVTLSPGITVQGKLFVEGQPISSVSNPGQLRLNLRNVAPPMGLGNPATSPIAADGSFQVAGLREGEYRVQISVNLPGFYVKSIKYGGKEILGKTFKFSVDDSESFEVVLKSGTPTITGKVTDSNSQPVPGISVILIPAQRDRLDLFRNTNTDQTGKFTILNLTPGEYAVFSWEAVDNNAYMDPEFLKQYEQLGKAISVTESSNSSVDVKLIPAQ